MENLKAEPRATSPQTSMTLSISRDDEQRMLLASKAFNKSLQRLQQQEIESESMDQSQPLVAVRKEASPTTPTETEDKKGAAIEEDGGGEVTRVVSTSDNDTVSASSSEECPKKDLNSKTKTPLHQLLVQAASECGDTFIGSLLAKLKASETPEQQMQACLLLFVEMDKSTKLITAFGILSDSQQTGGNPCADKDEPSLCLNQDGAIKLFQSFLTSISSCIHHEKASNIKPESSLDDNDNQENPRKALKEGISDSPRSSESNEEATPSKESTVELNCKSPSFDCAMETTTAKETDLSNDKTQKEINDIAVFAATQLMGHVAKRTTNKLVSFEDFGEWYNSGGFSVVPWLELLDLAKWNFSGRVADQKSKTTKGATTTTTSTAEPMSLAAIKEESITKVKSHSPTLTPGKLSSAKKQQHHRISSRGESPPNFFMTEDSSDTSKILVSFDFTSAMTKCGSNHSPFCINITQENLVMLRNLVHRTGLSKRSPDEVCNILLRFSKKIVHKGATIMSLHRDEFGRCIRELVPPEASREFTRSEMESFSTYFTNFLSCFENPSLGPGLVNVKELAVGFSFLCAGKKSTKLATGFELLDGNQSGYLTHDELTQYLRSYLTMLVGISLLSSSPTKMAETKKMLLRRKANDLFVAVENGSTWTLGHFLREFGENRSKASANEVTFEDFAQWYTNGGYNIAPWLELLDLSKLLSLLDTDGSGAPSKDNRPVPSSSSQLKSPASLGPQRPLEHSPAPPVEVLFTFPLANHHSLVVLREDATYVKSVVDKMGLMFKSPEDVWTCLYSSVKARPLPYNRSQSRNPPVVGKTMDTNQAMFVSGMEEVIVAKQTGGRKRSSSNQRVSADTKETLINFFQSFDLQQVDKVGLNQLMGGLTLLCGGKKSTKLAFAFGLFDSRNDDRENSNREKASPGHPSHSLNGAELFLFLRSFLIVMFSCCRQSLDLSAEAVSRYISDTANMVTEDVMRYQWHTRKSNRVNFDEFGEWYNEGGFETAPWFELLDLHKWVLMEDNAEPIVAAAMRSHSSPRPLPSPQYHGPAVDDGKYDCPPPPPDDAVDASFFGDDENLIMPMDSIDEMDYILMQPPTTDKENEVSFSATKFAPSPQARDDTQSRAPLQNASRGIRPAGNSLKFNLVTNENHGGYMLSISQARVRHFRHILTESGLCRIDAETACKQILSKATRVRQQDKKSSKSKKISAAKEDEGFLALTKDDFDSAMRSILASGNRGKPANMSSDTQRSLSNLLSCLFDSFDRLQTGSPNAAEVACGFTVLCAGKKSDKLEYAFELLDQDKDGKLSRRGMAHYLRSFLTALLSISSVDCLNRDEVEDNMCTMNGTRCDPSASNISQAVEAGSTWAAGQSFKALFKGKSNGDFSTFDDFAEWYTSVGYSSIPWLELLDLRKWVLVE